MTSTWLRRLGFAGLLQSLIACTGTPVTEPPSVAPPELPNVNANETLPEYQAGAGDYALPIGLSGSRGSIEPNSRVWSINLDGVAPPTVLRADADGSFEVPVQARVGDELRMHVLVDNRASLPLDMILGENLVLASPDRGTCVRALPKQIDFGESGIGVAQVIDLDIENTCDSTLELAVRLHPSATDFRLGQLGESTLLPGEATSVSITFEPLPSDTLLRSSVVLLDLSLSSVDDRIAVSLWGLAR